MLLSDWEKTTKNLGEYHVALREPVLFHRILKRSKKGGKEWNTSKCCSPSHPKISIHAPLLHRINPRFRPLTLHSAPDANPLCT